MTLFWVLAPIMVLAALGLLFVRKAVHAALLLAVVMLSLAGLYAALEAPFLFAVQIIVYTGAILMLFLFVLMLVGVDSSDSLVETIKGQRALAVVAGLLFGGTLVLALAQVSYGTVVGLSEAQSAGNVPAVANLLFSKYVFAFEATSALLITAAIGAMVLTHRERLEPKERQAAQAARRMQEYAEHGKHPGPLPSPGVFARHNAVGTPALLPDGSVSEASISRVLAARGTVRSAPAFSDDIDEVEAQLGGVSGPGAGTGDEAVDPTRMPETSGKSGAPVRTTEDVGPAGSVVEQGEQGDQREPTARDERTEQEEDQ